MFQPISIKDEKRSFRTEDFMPLPINAYIFERPVVFVHVHQIEQPAQNVRRAAIVMEALGTRAIAMMRHRFQRAATQIPYIRAHAALHQRRNPRPVELSMKNIQHLAVRLGRKNFVRKWSDGVAGPVNPSMAIADIH